MEHNIPETKLRDYEVDLRFFFTVFKKCWYWLVLVALLCGLAVGVFSSLFIEKQYSSTVNMYVDPNAQSSSSSLNSSTADALAATYPPVIRRSDAFAQKVALEMAKLEDENGEKAFPSWTYETFTAASGETVEVPKNWKRVRGMMSTGIMDDKIFYITIRSASPAEAYRLAEIAAEVAPDILNDIVGVGTVKVIGHPEQDSVPDSPNIKRNAVLAAVISAVIAYACFFFIRLFDNTVLTEADLARFNLPILGTVPTFPVDTAERDKKTMKGEVSPR